jgi:peptide/nickel transport system ATP-binding protein/oligopeptide transport system ATP-binding protein
MGKNMDANDVVLEVEHLTKHYPIKKGLFGKSDTCVHAVEDVSFEVHRGETFAIVGESGCGKSTTGKCILRLTEPTSGTVMLDGKDFTSLKGDDLVEARKKLKLIFQDPYSSLNPRMTVADIIAEPIDIAGTYKSRAERDARVDQIMGEVGLDLSYRTRYPHEFSGGQRQRIGIARAIVLEPQIVICDEPVSALDVSVQAKVINLLVDLQRSLGLSYVFISHDLSVVKHIADTVMVMYLGHMMERAPKAELFDNPSHPYTQALLDVIPRIRQERIRDKSILQGDVPSPTNPPSGCCFHTRCAACMRVCREIAPDPHEIAPGHLCACHLFDESLTDEQRTPAVEVPLDAGASEA